MYAYTYVFKVHDKAFCYVTAQAYVNFLKLMAYCDHIVIDTNMLVIKKHCSKSRRVYILKYVIVAHNRLDDIIFIPVQFQHLLVY